MPSGFIEHIRDLILFENVPLTRHISQLSATLVTCIKLLTLMAMFLARENKKSKTYLQLMSFIQMTKTTNIYILHENKECMELHTTLFILILAV
jgi:hypothetical protein